MAIADVKFLILLKSKRFIIQYCLYKKDPRSITSRSHFNLSPLNDS